MCSTECAPAHDHQRLATAANRAPAMLFAAFAQLMKRLDAPWPLGPVVVNACAANVFVDRGNQRHQTQLTQQNCRVQRRGLRPCCTPAHGLGWNGEQPFRWFPYHSSLSTSSTPAAPRLRLVTRRPPWPARRTPAPPADSVTARLAAPTSSTDGPDAWKPETCSGPTGTRAPRGK